ncbi:hypothetical protein EXIGLDRAFT_350919 [Exidia glandulosa HHB12029]|uniref:F-box domain-containing protein n=1 Tax=Exidia glandulosa HHB12029 TaxID=1314781 RepID=A0A165CD08_EXIGL|nr:hypothetical protein EXIGLDRAFT_350919 [Exidia glandulosa HHB12029]
MADYRLVLRTKPLPPPIYRLAPELIDDIFERVEWPYDTSAVARTCRRFYLRAMPILYRSIIISHKSPRATCAMLSCLERIPAVSAMVHSVVFDEATSAFYTPAAPLSAIKKLDTPRLRRQGSYELRRRVPMFPPPSKALDEMVWLVARVLPTLKNVRDVFLRAVHPCVLSPCLITYESAKSKLKRGLPPCMTGRVVPYHAFHLQPPHLTWHTLARLPVRRLSSLLLSKSAPHRGSLLLQRLHTLHLSGACFADRMAPLAWNDALRCMRTLHTLAITNVHQGIEDLLAGCYFAGLADLELYKVRADDENVLRTFIKVHAESLEVVSLCIAGHAFPDNAEFPRLRTLRVDNVAGIQCFACVYLPGDPAHGECKGIPRSCGKMATFVARHPTITDLALSGIPDTMAVHTIEVACVGRRHKMTRMLVGDDVLDEMRLAIPISGKATSEWRRKAERWIYYDFLFKGLELERAEYRPQVYSLAKMHKRHSIV